MTKFKFPPRFALENVDPLKAKVKYVSLSADQHFEVQIFENLEEATKQIDFGPFVYCMAEKIDGEWSIRIESKTANRILSA